MRRGPLPSGFSTLRDLILFVIGVAILIDQIFLSKSINPTSLGVGLALTGLPLALNADERRR